LRDARALPGVLQREAAQVAALVQIQQGVLIQFPRLRDLRVPEFDVQRVGVLIVR
jgi:hypothetical protein